MRTVTFSNGAVAAALNGKFICTWVNREPGFHNCDMTAERWISGMDCFATKNFCAFFATPELDVLHYASGYFGPGMFLDELKAVYELKDAVLDQGNRCKPDAMPKYDGVHERHAKAHLELAERLEAEEAPRRKSQGLKEQRKKHYVEGLRHLAAVHRNLAARAGSEAPTPLDSVFKDYLFGNSFEERKGRQEGPPRGSRSPGMCPD